MSKDQKNVGFYLLHNRETGKGYIGSGVLNDRKNAHFRELRDNNHVNSKLQAAFNENPNFEFIAIATESREEALAAEQALLDEQWGNPNLLNISRSAFKCRVEQTDETKAKIGAKHKGKVVSDESREKMSIAAQGREIAPEIREILRVKQTERMKDPEARAQSASYGMSGIYHSNEAKQKMSAAKKGIPLSEEHRRKLSEVLKDHRPSEEARIKGVEARKRAVMADGVKYDSLSAAAGAHGINSSSAHYRINNGDRFNWYYV